MLSSEMMKKKITRLGVVSFSVDRMSTDGLGVICLVWERCSDRLAGIDSH